MSPSAVRPITYLKTRAAELIAEVNKTRSPVLITQNGEPRAIVVDVATYERTQQALLMLKLVAQSEEDIRRGDIMSQPQVEAALQRRRR